MTFGSKVQQTVEVPPCQYIDRSVDIPVEMQRQALGTHRKLIAPHAWQLAPVWPWVSLRRRVTRVYPSSCVGRAHWKTLPSLTCPCGPWFFTDCAEQSPLFDITKAMVDPEPNAEFSLCSDLSSPVCQMCTSEPPSSSSRRLHVSTKLDNMCDFTHSENV